MQSKKGAMRCDYKGFAMHKLHPRQQDLRHNRQGIETVSLIARNIYGLRTDMFSTRMAQMGDSEQILYCPGLIPTTREKSGEAASQPPGQTPQISFDEIVSGIESHNTQDSHEFITQVTKENAQHTIGVDAMESEVSALERLQHAEGDGKLSVASQLVLLRGLFDAEVHNATACTVQIHDANDSGVLPHCEPDLQPCPANETRYACYTFLAHNDLSRLSPEDINFMEAKGCLHIPVKHLLDEFIRQYFLHIHPFLPILDEGSFWTMYQGEELQSSSGTRISLLVLQAMLFASCGVSMRFVVTIEIPSDQLSS